MREQDISMWLKLLPGLNEVQRRWYAAEKALSLGRGGIQRVHELTGISRPTITKGISEIRAAKELDPSQRLRRPGGGRKKVEVIDPGVVQDLEEILNETTAGDPMSAIKWTGKSARAIAKEMTRRGHTMNADTVCRLLHDLGYSLQGNRKTKEGKSHPDRDSQFRYLNRTVKKFLAAGEPVISVDSKKKERVGEFKNPGQTWRKKANPRDVNIYDFPSLAIGTAIPYGVYDIQRNKGMVNVGMSSETGEFAVESIRQWWARFGRRCYRRAKRLLISADGGGGNGSANRSWKFHLQELSDETGLRITVCHYPPGSLRPAPPAPDSEPGTSKWNKIGHRMFSFISLNWKGKPLVSYETVVNLIGSTRTETGLRVAARLDRRQYQTGVEYSEEEMAALNLERHDVNPKWNYTTSPRPARKRPEKRARGGRSKA